MKALDMLAVLRPLEFGHAVSQNKCMVCWGWNVGPNGETPRVHTPECPMPRVLATLELQAKAEGA